MNNNKDTSSAVVLPSTEALNGRKAAIQSMYQAQDGDDYPLVSDASALNNISAEELSKSYLVLWSQYNKDAGKPKCAAYQQNCRLYDLCCRANVLNATYLEYLNLPPIQVSKLPFHAWIFHMAPADVNGSLPGRAHAGKKSILKSFPVNDKNRIRTLDLVSTFGLGLLACEELLKLGTLDGMTNAEYTKLEANLNNAKEALSSAFKTVNIDGAFESTTANSNEAKAAPSGGA